MFQNHLLSIVAYTPLAGAILLLFVNKDHKNFIRWFANIVAAVGFLVSIPLVTQFDVNADGFQFVERHSWIPSLGVEYHFGIDGISLLLIVLTTGLGFLSILSSWTAIEERVKEYYICIGAQQSGARDLLLTLDDFLWFVHFEEKHVPTWVPLLVRGGC